MAEGISQGRILPPGLVTAYPLRNIKVFSCNKAPEYAPLRRLVKPGD